MAWSTSFHEAFSVVPRGLDGDRNVNLFLSSHGETEANVLGRWHRARGDRARPIDPKAFRNMSQLLRNVGLAYDVELTHDPARGAERTVQVTRLGAALLRWRLGGLNERNCRVIARHASRALAAAQLRNPTREGRRYAPAMRVFPFSFIWRAMLALDGRISSDELNRAIYATQNEHDLTEAIRRIKLARQSGNLDDMGPEQETAPNKNDRILIWMAWASFGWTLISPKESDPAYPDHYIAAQPWAVRVLEEAAAIRHRHRDFASVQQYVEFLSECAGVPPDLRGLP